MTKPAKLFKDMTVDEKHAALRSCSRTMRQSLRKLYRQNRKTDLATDGIRRPTLRALRDRGFISFQNIQTSTVHSGRTTASKKVLITTFNVTAEW